MSNRRPARIRSLDPPPSHFCRGGTPMFGLSAAVRVYLATKPADMRKSFDGLSALASGGLALWAKRLERGTFRLPAAGLDRVEMTTAELAALLAGIDLNTVRRRVRYSRPGTPLQNSENIAPTPQH